jgi:glyoxylase-like metal-dependent hydrolase (beta-lactamase superfamily II)
MDGIPISDQDVVSLDQVADGVVGLRIVMVNVFAVRGESGWILVDTGLPYSADRIRRWAGTHFGNVAPQAIILTHGHFDHVGSARELADGWNISVFAHPTEMKYITGKSEYPKPDPTVGGGLMSLLSPTLPRGPEDLSDRARQFPEGGPIPGLPEWRWIATPGHTDGHVSFFRERDRTLIAGDAFSTTKAESATAIATQRAELHGPPAYFTSDWDSAKRSVEELANLRPQTVAAGHGLPMSGSEVADALLELAANFDTVARPKSKRAA